MVSNVSKMPIIASRTFLKDGVEDVELIVWVWVWAVHCNTKRYRLFFILIHSGGAEEGPSAELKA